MDSPLEPETRRFRTLQAHFSRAGCCGQCSTYWAIVAVERELRRTDMVERPNCHRPIPGDTVGRCEAYAKAAWGERPRGEQQRRAA